MRNLLGGLRIRCSFGECGKMMNLGQLRLHESKCGLNLECKHCAKEKMKPSELKQHQQKCIPALQKRISFLSSKVDEQFSFVSDVTKKLQRMGISDVNYWSSFKVSNRQAVSLD